MVLTATLSTTIAPIILEHLILPPKPAGWPWWRQLLVYLQSFSYPIVGLALSTLPALEAHTRLLLGKYLEYRVTEKVQGPGTP